MQQSFIHLWDSWYDISKCLPCREQQQQQQVTSMMSPLHDCSCANQRNHLLKYYLAEMQTYVHIFTIVWLLMFDTQSMFTRLIFRKKLTLVTLWVSGKLCHLQLISWDHLVFYCSYLMMSVFLRFLLAFCHSHRLGWFKMHTLHHASRCSVNRFLSFIVLCSNITKTAVKILY